VLPLSGDPAKPATDSIEEAFVRLRQSLRGYLRRRLPGTVQVDDVLQDVFVKALASHRAGHRIANLTGWLYAAARTAVVDYYRTQGLKAANVDDEILLSDAPDEVALHSELSNCLRPFIERLPVLYRDTLVAIELDGKTMRSLADEQGLSVSAIKSRAARGRIMLKERVLACCHVEMAVGLVSDYHHRRSASCGGKCA
jgi:RNA polymerase sigma-70 factor, ECF subfamily